MSLTYHQEDGIRTLSYSLLEDLEACARKFQLYNIVGVKGNEHDRRSVDFAFGHAVGSGFQAALIGCDLETCYYECIINYSASSFIELDARIKKKLFHAMIAVRECYRIAQRIRNDYDVVELMIDGVPFIGIEPEFSIRFNESANYNGHIDVLLCHKVSKVPKVIEIKTTTLQSVHPSQYSNSNQVKGYSLAVKYLQFAGYLTETDYVDVEYHVYKSGKGEWETPLLLRYSHLDVIGYLKDLNTKLKVMDLYQTLDNFPMNGSACNNFFRACEFYNTCHWPTERFAKDERFNKTKELNLSVSYDQFKEFEVWLHKNMIEIKFEEESTPTIQSSDSEFLEL